jgi:hypothetical protein
MVKKIVNEQEASAHTLTVEILKKADEVFYRQRRNMEDSYGLPHGTFTKLIMAIFRRTTS